MSHPFQKIFIHALKKSSREENLVFAAAQKLKDKGYRAEEILGVLLRLQASLIDHTESALIQDAVDSFNELS